MAFRFSLASVLRVRENIERREERALQSIQLEMARVSRQLDELKAQLVQADAVRQQAMRTAMPAGELQDMLWKLQAAMATRSALETTLQELDAKRFAQMKLYQAAHSDHETMLNLQRDQRAAYELRQARVEQKFLDDIFMARRHRS